MSSSGGLILTYHSLDNTGSVLSTGPDLLRQQMDVVREHADRVWVTFDDGYANFHQHALRLLAGSGVRATVFVVGGFVGRQAGWHDAARLPLMDWAQLAECQRAGVEIGVHTARHAKLTKLAPEAAARELDECRDEIAQRLGVLPRTLAYPYGACNAAVRELAAARFECAVGTRLDIRREGDDLYELPRIEMHYYRDPERLRTLVSGRGAGYLRLRQWLRAAREKLC